MIRAVVNWFAAATVYPVNRRTNAMDEITTGSGHTSRRAALAGAVGAGVAITIGAGAAMALAACGNDDNNDDNNKNNGTGGAPQTGGTETTGTGVLAKKSDIPSGGGKIFDQENVVITQPTDGTFKAFTATCTHQQCVLSSVRDGTINCPCHGSRYSIADGSVKEGPALRPLAERPLAVDGENLSLG
jgi:Rieske Fe-S protein